MEDTPSGGSERVTLRRIRVTDEALVDRLLDRLTSYSLAVDGVPKPKNGAQHLLTGIPPGIPASSKHVFVVSAGEEPVGLVDVIDGYPRPGVAFIGLLAIAEDRHGRGLGRAAYECLEAYARDRLGASVIRLAVVASNPVRPFWRRMGFRETGEVRPYEGEMLTSDAHLMEKLLTA